MTTLEEIRKKARAKMNGCYVCPDCDGNACSGIDCPFKNTVLYPISCRLAKIQIRRALFLEKRYPCPFLSPQSAAMSIMEK